MCLYVCIYIYITCEIICIYIYIERERERERERDLFLGDACFFGEHKPGRIKPGRIKRAAPSLQNQDYYMFCFLIRPRLYASEYHPPFQKLELALLGHYNNNNNMFCFLIRPRLYAFEGPRGAKEGL